MGSLNTPLLSSSAIENLDDSEVRYPRYFNTLNHDVVADKMSALELAEAGLITNELKRQRLGITPGLLRLSVGIENAEDITADLLQALQPYVW